MTIIMLIIACGTRTPVLLWLVAMLCDTVLGVTAMALHALGKL